MNDYESLKKLLLRDEIQSIEELEEKFALLLKDTQDHDLIIQRLTPVIGDLLKETIANSSDEISKVMAPIMGDAIKEQVRTQKQTIVDALYPVMGNMIAKFVASALKDTLDEINIKVQNNFSMSAIKRKIKARLKGIPESELLLQESQLGTIESVFLIHTDSGLLICQKSKNDENIDEAEMVSAMLSAIRSFVNEWIAKSDDTFELNTIDYGDSKIYLEVSGSCYLALVVRGSIRTKMQERISVTLGDIIEKHGDTLSHFDGDNSGVTYTLIGKRLEQLFDTEPQVKPIDTPTQGIGFFLLITLILIFLSSSYVYYNSYVQDQQEAAIRDQFYHTPELNLYRLDIAIDGDEIILSGLLPNERLKNLAQKKVEMNNLDLKLINDIVTTRPFVTPEVIKEKLLLIENIYNHQKNIVLKSYFDRGYIILEGEAPNSLKMSEIIESYSNLSGIDKIISRIKVRPPKIEFPYTYNTAESSLSTIQKKILDDITVSYDMKSMANLYKGFKLDIVGYADGIGDMKTNQVYAFKRAENIYNYFLKSGVDKASLGIKAIPYPPKDYNTSQDLREARVVKFVWSYMDDR